MSEILEPTQKEYDLDDDDDKKAYDAMLDECSSSCSTCERYGASRILAEIDPVAYRCGFVDWIDGQPERWECPVCNEVHEDEDDAKWCCQEEPEDEEEDDDEVI